MENYTIYIPLGTLYVHKNILLYPHKPYNINGLLQLHLQQVHHLHLMTSSCKLSHHLLSEAISKLSNKYVFSPESIIIHLSFLGGKSVLEDFLLFDPGSDDFSIGLSYSISSLCKIWRTWT